MTRPAICATLSLAAALALGAGCSTTNINCSFNGLDTPAGTPIAHVNTSRVACHWFGAYPLFGDANLKTVFNEFTEEAKRLNGSKVRVVESNRSRWYWAFPPFTLIFTPVVSQVAGDVMP